MLLRLLLLASALGLAAGFSAPGRAAPAPGIVLPSVGAVTKSGLPSTLGALAGVASAATLACAVSSPAATAPKMELLGVAAFSVALVAVFLQYSAMAAAEAGPAEACLVEFDEPLCGPLSFDSTDDYVCVETFAEGKLRWVCQ